VMTVLAIVGAFGLVLTPPTGHVLPGGPAASFEQQLLQRLGPDGGGAFAPGIELGSAVAIDGDIAAVGAPRQRVWGAFSGAVYVFHREGDEWVEVARLTSPDGTGGPRFGSSLAIDGSVLVVGAPYASVGGAAHVFRMGSDASDWSLETRLSDPGGTNTGRFGSALALADDALVVCAPSAQAGEHAGAGRCEVFRHSEGEWGHSQSLEPTIRMESAEFGASVAASAGVIAVGAWKEEVSSASRAGATYVFRENGSSFEFEARLVAPAPAPAGGLFGAALALRPPLLAVGAPTSGFDGSTPGEAHLYRYSDGGWSYQAGLTPSAATEVLEFGKSVAIAGEKVLVGSPGGYSPTGPGAVVVFTEEDGGWIEELALVPGAAAVGDRFGSALAVHDELLLAGAPLFDGLGEDSGAAYLFEADGAEWTELEMLEGRGSNFLHEFGYAVAGDAETIVVGARADDGSGLLGAGAVYVFSKEGAHWSLNTRLTAPDAEESAEFGISVALAQDTIVVGSHRDDAGARDGGAVYIFGWTEGQWQFVQKLQSSEPTQNAGFGGFVAIDAETVVTSSVGGSLVFVYQDDGGVWSEEAVLRPFGTTGGVPFPTAVALAGDTLVASGRNDPQGAAAYVYTRVGSDWSEQARLGAPEASDPSTFSNSLAIEGDVIAVGEPVIYLEGELSHGRVLMYEREGSEWALVAELVAPNATVLERDRFGWALDLDGESLLVGAPDAMSRSGGTGTAFVFGTDEGGGWSQLAQVDHEELPLDGGFGSAITAAGGSMVVGAPVESSPEGFASAGAAYVFGARLEAPVADFSWSPIHPEPGSPVLFEDMSSGEVASRLWLFGDGDGDRSASPVHTFQEAGDFTVTLRVSNEAGTDSVAHSVVVGDASAVAGLSWSPAHPRPGGTVQFHDASSGTPVSWAWDFGDGAVSSDRNPSHEYGEAGNYVVILTVADGGASDTAHGVITASADMPPPPHVTIPAVARVQGTSAFFTSRIDLLNAGDVVVDVEVVYTPRVDIGGSSRGTTLSLAPALLQHVEDPLGTWLGLDDSEIAVGSVFFTVQQGPPEALLAQSVVLARNEDGTEYGQYFPATRPESALETGATVYLATTVDSERTRVNVGAMAMEDGTTLEVVPVDPVGAPLAEPRALALDFAQSAQLNDLNVLFGLGDRESYLLDVRVEAGRSVVYVSVLDGNGDHAGTNDPTTVLPVSDGAPRVTLLELGPVQGIDEFSGSASVSNLSSVPAAVELRFFARDDGEAGAAAQETLTLSAGETAGFTDLVGEVFGVQGVGTVELVASEPARIAATGREFSIIRGDGEAITGTAGQLMAGMTDDERLEPGVTYHLLGLREHDTGIGLVRSHVAFFNPSAEAAEVLAVLYDGRSGEAEGEQTFLVPGEELVQVNGVIGRINSEHDGRPKRLEVTVDRPLFGKAFRVNRDGDPITIDALAVADPS